MHWIKRLSADEWQDAKRLSEQHTATKLAELSEHYGQKDERYRHWYVPLSAFAPYLVAIAHALGAPMTNEQMGWWVVAGMFCTLMVLLIAREVWFRWCVIELAYRLRLSKDQEADQSAETAAGKRNAEDSPYAITE